MLFTFAGGTGHFLPLVPFARAAEVAGHVIAFCPLGAVSPLTALSPAITAVLAVALLRERLTPLAYLGVALAPIGVVLLSRGPTKSQGQQRWLLLAILSLILQGIAAFIAKLVVSPTGPSALLLMGAAVQVVVGLFLAPPRAWSAADFRGRAAALPSSPTGLPESRPSVICSPWPSDQRRSSSRW